ncbi:hypothetical protein, partial [Pseudomonas sp.]
QEALTTGLFTLASVLSISEGDLFHRGARKTGWIYLTRIWKSFSEFPLVSAEDWETIQKTLCPPSAPDIRDSSRKG